MWNVFQNDLAEFVIKTDFQLSLYADDQQTFSSDNSIAKVEERVLHNGNKMTSWYEEDVLKLKVALLDFLGAIPPKFEH